MARFCNSNLPASHLHQAFLNDSGGRCGFGGKSICCSNISKITSRYVEALRLGATLPIASRGHDVLSSIGLKFEKERRSYRRIGNLEFIEPDIAIAGQSQLVEPWTSYRSAILGRSQYRSISEADASRDLGS